MSIIIHTLTNKGLPRRAKTPLTVVHKTTKSRGFTIVELLIVVVIIAVLAAITIVSKTKAEMEKLDEKLVQLTNGDKSFVVTSSYLLDLTQIAGKLFRSSKPELKSKILSLVLSNLELDNKKLHFNLLSPFDRLLSYAQSSIWLTTIEEVITIFRSGNQNEANQREPDLALLF